MSTKTTNAAPTGDLESAALDREESDDGDMEADTTMETAEESDDGDMEVDTTMETAEESDEGDMACEVDTTVETAEESGSVSAAASPAETTLFFETISGDTLAASFASLHTEFDMPSTVRVTSDETSLPMGFDLTLGLQQILQVLLDCGLHRMPNRNIEVDADDPRRKNKKMSKEQEAYFWKLVEYGCRLRGHGLWETRDFLAITDAMHRRFKNDPDYLPRGYNNLHSHGIKKTAYEEWLVGLGIPLGKRKKDEK